jgi:hypothetical protein
LPHRVKGDKSNPFSTPAKPQPKTYEAKANPLSPSLVEKLDVHAANKRRMAQKAEADHVVALLLAK